jgi:uncharacterized membrane protein
MDNKHLNVFALFMSFLMLSSLLVLYVPPEAEAQSPTPDFTLEVAPGSITLDVSPRGTGVGTTVVTVKSQSAHTITVEVNINVPGYQVSPTRSTITVGSLQSTTINVAVAALLRTPYRQSQGEVHGTVTHVDGAPVSAGYEQNTGFFVTSKLYGKVILSSAKPFRKVSPGKEYPFKVDVVNNGNGVDQYILEIVNKDKLQDKGFSITLSSTKTQDVPQGGKDIITIQVQTPRKTWRNEYYTIDVKATSDVDPSETTEYSLTVWVWGFYVPGFELTFTLISLAIVGAFMAKKKQS